MTDLLFLLQADGHLIQKFPPLLIGAIGIIDRKENAISTQHLQREHKRWVSEDAAGCNREVA